MREDFTQATSIHMLGNILVRELAVPRNYCLQVHKIYSKLLSSYHP